MSLVRSLVRLCTRKTIYSLQVRISSWKHALAVGKKKPSRLNFSGKFYLIMADSALEGVSSKSFVITNIKIKQ